MTKTLLLMLAVTLAACGRSEAPPAPLPTVDELAADAGRLKALREQCRMDRAKTGEELCVRVNEATRKRFFNDGTVPYTPPKEPPKL